MLIDQLSKEYVVKNYDRLYRKTYGKKFRIRLAKNTGAAYSILSNKTNLLIYLTVPMLLGLLIYLTYILNSPNMLLTKIFLSFVLGGGIGNLIDRIRLKYVIDFLYIDLKKMPIFNIADVFIFISAFIGIVLLMFGYEI